MLPAEESSAIGAFAATCESLNEFARTLKEQHFSQNVRAGSDIRSYGGGWRLEKWVEAELNQSTGLWAAWWLELGWSGGEWVVESHIAISPDELYSAFPTRRASTNDQLQAALTTVLQELLSSIVQDRAFVEGIARSR